MFSAAGVGLMHGTNDAQKTMGIIALALAAGTANGRLDSLPWWLSFLRSRHSRARANFVDRLVDQSHLALVMAAGTAGGGWRIIRTLGHKMVHLHPVNGFAAESSSAAIIGICSHFGLPVSTTHNISASIMGVGAAKRFSALKWTIVERMVWAWLLTIPICGTIAWIFMRLLQLTGHG